MWITVREACESLRRAVNAGEDSEVEALASSMLASDLQQKIVHNVLVFLNVLGEHSGEGKSNLSTRRSVPMADRLLREVDAGSQRTAFKR